MGYKLVIAEKPMLARDIARAMCGREVSESARLPISGNGYTVVACAGHLLELVDPEAIDPKWKEWSLDTLPIEVPDWPKEPTEDKRDLVSSIADLLADTDCVINAGDPDDKGQLIVDEVLDYLGYTGKVLRVYVNDNIEKNIRKAFDQLLPNEECRPAGEAAYARQMADMCFGVNETRLATKRLGGLFSVGRVQTPTLGLVVSRDEAIEHHVSRKYYELAATGNCPDTDRPVVFRFKPNKELLGDEKHLFERADLDHIKGRLDGTTTAFTTELSEKVENPPLPYNLTVLLSDMSRRYGFTASKTQQITQDLRDKYKAITYNRSDSQYLKEEHFAQAPVVLPQAMRNLGVSWELDYSIHSKAFNEKNVTAHHGIIPQEVDAPVDKMTKDEAKVYRAIVERYAAQFLPPAVYDVSTSTFDVAEGVFSATCNRVRDAGFKATFGSVSDDDDEGRRAARGSTRASTSSPTSAAPSPRRKPRRLSPTPRAPSSPTWPPSPSTSGTRRSRPSSRRRTTARRVSTAASAPRPPARLSSKSSRSAVTLRRSIRARPFSSAPPRRPAPSTTCSRLRLPVPTSRRAGGSSSRTSPKARPT